MKDEGCPRDAGIASAPNLLSHLSSLIPHLSSLIPHLSSLISHPSSLILPPAAPAAKTMSVSIAGIR
jgi:hypothetical protein